MKLYDKNAKKGINIKISESARNYQKKKTAAYNPEKYFQYLKEDKMTLKGNVTVIFQNISILLITAMILMVNYGVNLYFNDQFTPEQFESFIKKDIHPVPATPILVYDETNDIDIVEAVPVQESPEKEEAYNLELIDQNAVGLPNGCEAVAMTMLLRKFIPDLSPHEFVNLYLPTAPYLKTIDGILTGSDPEYYYIGNAAGAGYGIFAAGLAQGAQKCLDAYNITERKVYDVSGLSDEELFEYIEKGHYVVVWITMNMSRVVWGSKTWHLPSGKLYKWPGYEHCALLTGHDANTVTLYDPTNGIISYDKAVFLSRWHEMGPYEGQGRQAIVIY